MIRCDGKCPNCVRSPPLLTSPCPLTRRWPGCWYSANDACLSCYGLLQRLIYKICWQLQMLVRHSQAPVRLWHVSGHLSVLCPLTWGEGWWWTALGTGVSEHMTHETRPVWAVPWQCSRQGWWLCPVLGTTVSGALNMQQHISWTHNIYKHWLSICDTYKLLGWHCDMWQHGLCPLAVSS